MTPESSNPIFIHSLWRAGSTYLFQVFRRSEAKYYCYQEPLNEIVLLNKDTPEKLLEYSADLMRALRHPALSQPYYQELYDTNRFWKDKITKSDIYDTYFSSECSGTLSFFLNALIEHAQGRTVIQECRTSNRIGALKKYFGGIHLYLWRNPWDQWWSYKSNDYFDMVQLLLINAENAPPVIKALRQALHFKPYHGTSLQDEMQFFNVSRLTAENSYSSFYMLWCLALLEAQQHANFLLNIDQLSSSSVYKAEFLEIMGGTGISGLDFSDCRIHCTQFTQQDASFFKPLEDMVHELLLQYFGAGQVDAIKEAREKGMPESQKVLPESAAENVVLEDARRAREVVVRLETTFHNRMQQQLLLQEHIQQEFLQQAEQQTVKLQNAVKHKKELQLEQLAMHIRSAEREREFSNQLESIHRLADQEKQELNQQFLVMQARSTEREREIAEQLQALHASYRQSEVANEERFQCVLNQISNETTVLYNSLWWRVGAFFGWLPKTRFESLSAQLTAGKRSFSTGDLLEQTSAANNMPLPSIEFIHRDDTVVEEESLIEMDTIDQLLLSSETEFVTKAYQLILGRQADPTGIAHYRKWLRAGKSRVEILADLMASQEAQLANRPGLDDLRVLIRQTGAGLKGWRKWLALPVILNHRMAIFERQITTLATNDELLLIKAKLARNENQLLRQSLDPQVELYSDGFQYDERQAINNVELSSSFNSVSPLEKFVAVNRYGAKRR